MSNLVANAGFERDEGWTFTGLSNYTTDDMHGEHRSLFMAASVSFTGSRTEGDARQFVSVPLPGTYVISAWVKHASGGVEPGVLTLSFSGDTLESRTYDTTPVDWHEWVQFVNASAGTSAIAIHSSGVGTWYVDDVRVEYMAKTAELRAALVEDLADISTGNGFSVTLTEVGTDPKVVSEVAAPAVWVSAGAGATADVSQLGNVTGTAAQSFALELLAGSKTELDNLTDDVRNAIERSTSALGNVSGVEYWGVSEWTEPMTSEDVAQRKWVRGATVTVRYLFTRGAA